MKNLFISFLCGSVLFFNSTAQNANWCGTKYTQEADQWRKANAYLNQVAADNLRTTYYLPIKIHAFGDNSGKGYFTRGNILTIMNKLNNDYAPVGFRFYLAGTGGYITQDSDIDRIPNDYFYNGQYSDRDELFVYNTLGVLNAYIVKEKDQLCGRANFPPEFGGLELISNCLDAANSTFAHELGHWLSLPHPFSGWCDECVSGSNCLSCGDGFCDTPADYKDYRWTCGDAGELDACGTGTPSNPDGTLYMSYSNDECANKFSNEQINGNSSNTGMLATLLSSSRNFLINYANPPKDAITGTEQFIVPYANDTIPYHQFQFRWTSVPGATLYHFQLCRSTLWIESLNKVDIYTADTFYNISLADQLVAGQRYYWRVKPFNPTEYGASYAMEVTVAYRTVYAADSTHLNATGLNVFSNPGNAIRLFPNPIRGENDLTIEVQTDKQLEVNCKIYDINGKLQIARSFDFSRDSKVNSIAIGELSPGVYFIKIVSGSFAFQDKLIVVN